MFNIGLLWDMINNYLLVLYFKYKFWNETWYIILSQFNEQ